MDIAGDDQFRPRQTGQEGTPHGVDPAECIAGPRQFLAAGGEEGEAEGGQHAHAAVGAGAAAQSQDDPGRGQAEREQDRVSEPTARGISSASNVPSGSSARPQVLATSTTAVMPSKAMAGLNRVSGWTSDGAAAAGEARGDGGVDAAVAAVGQGQQFALDPPGAGPGGGPESGRQGLCDLAWR